MSALAGSHLSQKARSKEAWSGAKPLAVQVVRQYAPNRGGLEDVVAHLSDELRKHGYRVRVVTLDRLFTALDKTLPAAEMIDGVEVVRIPFGGSTRYPVAPQVFRHIRDADIVHVHAIDFFFDALAWTYPLHRKPLIATTHGGFFHTDKHALLKTLWFNGLTRLSARAYHAVVGCSAQDAQVFARIAGARVVRIDNGVDVEKFAGVGSQKPVRHIVTLGRFSTNKRLDRLLAAMARLVRLNADWRLDIIGVPGDQSLEDIRQMIEAQGLSASVALHADLSETDIKTVFGRCSLFASASDYEGFGLVAIEAMSAGLMPLLHPNTAYRDLAASHSEIRLCDFNDSETAAATIASAFEALRANVDAYRAAAMACVDAYAWNEVGQRYADLYRKILLRDHPHHASENPPAETSARI